MYVTPCKKCGCNIYFKKIQQIPPKYMPYNELDGRLHFDTCLKKDEPEIEKDPRYKLVTCIDCQLLDCRYGHCSDWGAWLNHSAVYNHKRYRRWNPVIDLDHTRRCGCVRCGDNHIRFLVYSEDLGLKVFKYD